MFRKILFFLIFIFILNSINTTAIAETQPIYIVSAENFYGEIAKQMGGPYVQVYSIMHNPNQDPHLFSANIATAKAVADANIIIYNGLDYDPWMENLISANVEKNKINNKRIIIVADLINKKPGDNPHVWYDPHIILMYARYLDQKLIEIDPMHKLYYLVRLAKFEKNTGLLLDLINHIKNHHENTPVIATEPVFNYMAEVLGLKMFGFKFQLSIMNNTSPSVQESKDFEDKLKYHLVKLLIYNQQVSNPLTQRMQMLAKQYHIPVIGVTETQPIDQDYITWMSEQLHDLDKALSHGRD